MEKLLFFANNIDGALEGYDPANDASFLDPIQPNALEIYSNVEGHILSTDARPINTYGFDFILAIKGTVTDINNSLRYNVTDSANLVNPAIIIGGTTYPLIMDGAMHSISLPNVTGTNTEYDTGYLQLQEEPSGIVPETSGLIGLVLGGAGLAASRLGRRKE